MTKMKKSITALAFSVFVILLISFSINIKKFSLYKKALSTVSKEESFRILKKLKNYKDSEALLLKLETEDPLLPFKILSKGDEISFGKFDENLNEKDGEENLHWILIDSYGGELLFLSRDIIEARPYHSKAFAEITWKDSEIRSYLNGEFYNTVFSQSEKDLISLSENKNEDQSVVGTEGGEVTFDKVFLLSEIEYGVYVNDDYTRDYFGKAFPSERAKAAKIMMNEEGFAPWWLRSPGVYPYSAQFVTFDGNLHVSGAYIDNPNNYGLRPAIRIRLWEE